MNCPHCGKEIYFAQPTTYENLRRIYGHQIVDDLEERAKQIHKYTREELEEIISVYSDKIKDLK